MGSMPACGDFRDMVDLVEKPRRFPPPWTVDDPDMKLGQDCYIVRATPTGTALRLRLLRGQRT